MRHIQMLMLPDKTYLVIKNINIQENEITYALRKDSMSSGNRTETYEYDRVSGFVGFGVMGLIIDYFDIFIVQRDDK